MKVVDQVEIVVPANATVDNAFTGRRFERAPFSGFLDLYATGSAAGLEAELNVGGRSVTPRVPLSSQNRTPLVPDDLLVSGVEVFRGELVQVTVVNTTASGLTARFRMELEEAEEVIA